MPHLQIAVAASGAGSNARKIFEHFQQSPLARVAVVLCNKPGAGVLNIAAEYGIPTLIVERDRFFKGDGYVPELKGIDLIALAGFLWKVPQPLLDAFPRRIINIHPALLPKYGGKGMYGHYVHEAVLAAGETESGITIHYVDDQYDHGDSIFQARCAVPAGASATDIAQAVLQLEHRYYPAVLEDVLRSLP